MAFLIYEHNITVEDALQIVKEKIPGACPSVGFINQLQECQRKAKLLEVDLAKVAEEKGTLETNTADENDLNMRDASLQNPRESINTAMNPMEEVNKSMMDEKLKELKSPTQMTKSRVRISMKSKKDETK